MKTAVEILKENGFKGIGKAEESQIENAQNELGLKFADEYKDFLRNFKAGSFRGHEFMGIETMAYLNVVNNTEDEREMNDDFPQDCIVIENLGIEGLLTIMDPNGIVYSYINGRKEKIANSFSEYILQCC